MVKGDITDFNRDVTQTVQVPTSFPGSLFSSSSLFQRPREEEKRDPGNEVVWVLIVSIFWTLIGRNFVR